jgi:hypothetical protein
MKLYPDQPYRTKSKGELIFFDLLEDCECLNQRTVAMHSLNLTRHEYKRFGEADFVIIGPEGLFVIEVKGGRVSRNAKGIWEYTDTRGVTHTNREGPFKQAETAMFAIVKRLEKQFSSGIVKKLIIGYGVAFPQCSFSIQSVEWDNAIVMDETSLDEFDGWLKGLITFWRNKHNWISEPLDSAVIRNIRQFLRPKFDVSVSLKLQADALQDQIVSMTQDQYRLLDVIAANRKAVCSGGAGTGKTFLALELARRWTAAGKTVLIVCKSLWLSRFLENLLHDPNLVIATMDYLPVVMKRSKIERFDSVIVDEGQDLLDIDSLSTLDDCMWGGFQGGQWCFFHDVNNQKGLIGVTDLGAMDLLQDFQAVNIPLTTNCRNTRVILDYVQRFTGCDMGVKGAGEGPEVKSYFYPEDSDSNTILVDELNRLIRIEKINPGEITILSPLDLQKSSISKLRKDVLQRLIILDEYSLREFPPADINFASIHAFKGLENTCIIIVDLDETTFNESFRSALYVAMSRARAVLTLIFPKSLESKWFSGDELFNKDYK